MMLRKLTLVTAFTTLLLGWRTSECNSARAEAPLTIYASNRSRLPEARFREGINHLNLQLRRDFGPRWGISARVVEGGSQNLSGATIVIQPVAESPYRVESYAMANGARVNYELAEKTNPDGYEEIRCMSHECINMLMLHFKKAIDGLSITDCCGGNAYPAEPGGPQDLCDFAFPSFCVAEGKAPFDMCKSLTAPLTPLPGHKLIYYANQQ
jgi:hypothetical protein